MMNINFPIRHSGAGRNPAGKILRVADIGEKLSRFAGSYSIIWIPVCAGMTESSTVQRNRT
jgi:hypothetical protein